MTIWLSVITRKQSLAAYACDMTQKISTCCDNYWLVYIGTCKLKDNFNRNWTSEDGDTQSLMLNSVDDWRLILDQHVIWLKPLLITLIKM